jgi:hypothetical protein
MYDIGNMPVLDWFGSPLFPPSGSYRLFLVYQMSNRASLTAIQVSAIDVKPGSWKGHLVRTLAAKQAF